MEKNNGGGVPPTPRLRRTSGVERVNNPKATRIKMRKEKE